jgi:hypothetical protein
MPRSEMQEVLARAGGSVRVARMKTLLQFVIALSLLPVSSALAPLSPARACAA